MKHRILIRAATVLLILCTLCGCGSKSAAPDSPAPVSAKEHYIIPEFREAVFHPEPAEDFGVLQIDFSGLADGYIALRAASEERLKFQIFHDDQKYTYDVPGDGTATVLPLNMGDGSYEFRLMKHVADSRYSCVWSDTREVVMTDEFQCFLRPSQMANYNENSQCVAMARQLAADCATDIDVVHAIYEYLVAHIRYDREKAATVSPGYLPDPDETLATGKGICFDYASLAAAMLRSMGIPCKLITGYVDGELYHAWNCIYIQGQGWVTVGIQASPNSWQQVDITFAANGTKTEDLLNTGRYTTKYTY